VTVKSRRRHPLPKETTSIQLGLEQLGINGVQQCFSMSKRIALYRSRLYKNHANDEVARGHCLDEPLSQRRHARTSLRRLVRRRVLHLRWFDSIRKPAIRHLKRTMVSFAKVHGKETRSKVASNNVVLHHAAPSCPPCSHGVPRLNNTSKDR